MNKILAEASLGWGKAALGFGADQIRTLASMAANNTHRVIMGKRASSHFLSLNEIEIWPDPTMDYRVSFP